MKMVDCLQMICKSKHDHDYKVIKFGSADEALAFGIGCGKPDVKWQRNPYFPEDTSKYYCEVGCPAQWSFKETRRPNDKIDFVFRGCLAHGLNCKQHESNRHKPEMINRREDKLSKDSKLKEIFPDWESARKYLRDHDLDLIFRIRCEGRNPDGILQRRYFACHRGGEPVYKHVTNNAYISKKIGCPAKCNLRKTSRGIEFSGIFEHNHEEFEGARRRGGFSIGL